MLCAHPAQNSISKDRAIGLSVDELLPPLTSSNEVDLQLYALIAVVVREFIDPWYGNITSDRVFVDEIVHIIAHCTRAIEERLRQVDLETLIVDHIPALVDAHISGSVSPGF